MKNYPQMIWDKMDGPHDFKTGEWVVLKDGDSLLAPMTVGKSYRVDCPGRWVDSIFVKDDRGQTLECKAKRFERAPAAQTAIEQLGEAVLTTTRNYLRTEAFEVTPHGIRKVHVLCTELYANEQLHTLLSDARKKVTQKPRVQYSKCIRN